MVSPFSSWRSSSNCLGHRGRFHVHTRRTHVHETSRNGPGRQVTFVRTTRASARLWLVFVVHHFYFHSLFLSFSLQNECKRSLPSFHFIFCLVHPIKLLSTLSFSVDSKKNVSVCYFHDTSTFGFWFDEIDRNRSLSIVRPCRHDPNRSASNVNLKQNETLDCARNTAGHLFTADHLQSFFSPFSFNLHSR